MKLDKLADALRTVRGFGLDATDVLLLSDIAAKARAKTPVTIMTLVENSDAASPATNHARIKHLCDGGFLKKVEMSGSLRHRVLEKDAQLDKFLAALAEV